MSTLDNDSLSQLTQILSSLNLSPEELQSLLQDPKRVMDLMMSTTQDTTETMPGLEMASSNTGNFQKELDEEDARCKQEAKLPLRKPAPTQRTDLELDNREVSENMSTPFLKTFIGQQTHFSTTPVTQLTRGA